MCSLPGFPQGFQGQIQGRNRLPVSIPRPVSLPESPLRLLQARAQRQSWEDVLLASGANATAYAPIASTIASLVSASFHMTSLSSGLARDVESERRLPRTGTLSCQASVESQRLAFEACLSLESEPRRERPPAAAAGPEFQLKVIHRQA